ncbi:hypothetical protein TNCV_2859181 [Trichonephila clavipes]|nr:hypothetical protein TNCV_2859181 [Trichonephila clavipes]
MYNYSQTNRVLESKKSPQKNLDVGAPSYWSPNMCNYSTTKTSYASGRTSNFQHGQMTKSIPQLPPLSKLSHHANGRILSHDTFNVHRPPLQDVSSVVPGFKLLTDRQILEI